MEQIITEDMIQAQRQEIEQSLNAVRETAMRYKMDSERIDKLERMAKASRKGSLVPTYRVDDGGELVNLSRFSDEPIDEGFFATVREAIDAAPEEK